MKNPSHVLESHFFTFSLSNSGIKIMEDHSPIIPAAAVKGIATGLLMMSVFTLIGQA